MAKKKKPRRVGKPLKMAKRIFAELPDGAQTGGVYYKVLRECGIKDDDAKTIAGRWLLERSREKPA